MIYINGQKRTTLTTESAFWWTKRGSSHPTQKSPVYSLVSGKSPVFPDKVGRKVFSVLHNRYGLKVMGFVEWSVDGLAQLCSRNGTFGGQTMIPTQLCPRNRHFGGQTGVSEQLCPRNRHFGGQTGVSATRVK